MTSKRCWKSSRFNFLSRTTDGALLVYNSLSGALVKFEGALADKVADFLSHPFAVDLNDDMGALASQGIIVPDTADELARASYLHQSQFHDKNHLQLILMPTEACNFRCVYCYETFSRGAMTSEVTESIIRLIFNRSIQLRSLHISWFGGEPLAALKTIEKISKEAISICHDRNVRYSANITTNAYMLSAAVAQRCFDCDISNFQITLDGPAETHDKLRVLANGNPTFDKVIGNLRSLRAMSRDYHVRIRVNYTPETVPYIPAFVQTLALDFAGDTRFSIQFHAVGHWGGPNDHQIQICDQKSSDSHELQFMSLASQASFSLNAWQEAIRPFGSVCYAADPRSFVIGSDGSVYKCTVAFDDPRNQIGRLMSDGTLAISETLHSLWTASGEERDAGCQACAFRPACQGNMCPLERLNTGYKVCPPFKRKAQEFLPVLAEQAARTSLD
jgi:uncharacterized protein